MTNAPFATRPVCVVELGAWLNMKNGQGQFEWRSSGMIAHWSPDTMHWILYRLPPQDILPRESHKGFFALPSSAGSDSKASGMTRDQYLLDVPRVQVPAKHLAHIAARKVVGLHNHFVTACWPAPVWLVMAVITALIGYVVKDDGKSWLRSGPVADSRPTRAG